jgi:hypothetical protein
LALDQFLRESVRHQLHFDDVWLLLLNRLRGKLLLEHGVVLGLRLAIRLAKVRVDLRRGGLLVRRVHWLPEGWLWLLVRIRLGGDQGLVEASWRSLDERWVLRIHDGEVVLEVVPAAMSQAYDDQDDQEDRDRIQADQDT